MSICMTRVDICSLVVCSGGRNRSHRKAVFSQIVVLGLITSNLDLPFWMCLSLLLFSFQTKSDFGCLNVSKLDDSCSLLRQKVYNFSYLFEMLLNFCLWRHHLAQSFADFWPCFCSAEHLAGIYHIVSSMQRCCPEVYWNSSKSWCLPSTVVFHKFDQTRDGIDGRLLVLRCFVAFNHCSLYLFMTFYPTLLLLHLTFSHFRSIVNMLTISQEVVACCELQGFPCLLYLTVFQSLMLSICLEYLRLFYYQPKAYVLFFLQLEAHTFLSPYLQTTTFYPKSRISSLHALLL